MGTNYYWRHNICSCCGRYDEWHICKSMTSFQAHFGEEEWNQEALRYDPAPVLVSSWAEWKHLLRSDGGVWDEYGDHWDVDEFITRVEATDPANRRRQYEWCRDHSDRISPKNIDKIGRDGEWLDTDGFSFYGGEFS